jgi:hypothetical protein
LRGGVVDCKICDFCGEVIHKQISLNEKILYIRGKTFTLIPGESVKNSDIAEDLGNLFLEKEYDVCVVCIVQAFEEFLRQFKARE